MAGRGAGGGAAGVFVVITGKKLASRKCHKI